MNYGIAGYGIRDYMIQPVRTLKVKKVSRRSRRSETPRRSLHRRHVTRISDI